MANMKSLAKDTAIYGLSSIIGRFLNYLLVPLYTYKISAASGGYGVVTNLYAYTALLLVILTYGMETTFFRFANKEGEDPRKVYSTILRMVGTTSLLFVALVLAFIRPISVAMGYPDHPSYIWTMAIIVALDAFQAILFSYLRYRKQALKFAALKLLFIGMNIGLNLPPWAWVAVIAVYLVAASLAPVWALLQPRDFLSAFLLWGMMLVSLVALLVPALGGKTAAMPAVNEAAFSGGALFSMLSVIVFGGAVSGYNALIASGTSSKQLANEKHARPVAVGSVILNAVLALTVLLAVLPGIPDHLTPLEAFAAGVANAAGNQLVYYLMMVAAVTFAITTLDTCTRLARYLFAELFNPDNRRLKKLEGAQRFFATPAVGTVIVVLLGCGLSLVRDLDCLWGLFGAANLLLAGLALMIAAIWLRGEGKKTGMLVVPMFLLLAVSLAFLVWNAVRTLTGLAGWIDWLSLGLSAVLLVLAVILLAQALPVLFGKQQPEAEEE